MCGDVPAAPITGFDDWARENAKHRRIAGEFWGTSPLKDLVLARNTMQPLRTLMLRKQDLASEAWENDQQRNLAGALLGNGEPAERQYRICVVAGNQHEEECLRDVWLLFSSEDLWRTMPIDGYTVSHRCLAFRILSNIKCSVAERLVGAHDNLPVALFKTMNEPDAFEWIRRIPVCRTDAWSAEFLAEHGHAIVSPLSKATLRLYAQFVSNEMVAIESRNAAIRRTCVFNNVANPQIDILRLSREFLFQRSRALSSRLRMSAESAKTTRQTKLPKAKLKKSPLGGGQRAYISEQLVLRQLKLYNPGVASMLNREYNGLTASVRARYQRSGIAGARLRRRMLPSSRSAMSTFGAVRSRDARRKAARVRRSTLFGKCIGLSPYELAITLSHSDQILSNPCDSDAWKSGFSNARSFKTLERTAVRNRVVEGDCAVGRWQAGDGATNLSEFSRALKSPLPAFLKDRLVPQPSVGFNWFKLDVCDPCTVQAFAGFIFDNKIASDVKKAFLEDHTQRHLTILETASPSISDGVHAGTGPDHACKQCWQRGVCICSLGGILVARFCNSLTIAFKSEFKHNTTDRTVLGKHGFIVAQLVGYDFRGVHFGGDVPRPSEELWLHIGRLSLSPLLPTYQYLRAVSREPSGECVHPDRVLLEVVDGPALRQCAAIDKLNFGLVWDVVHYVLEDTPRPIGHFLPGQVSAIKRSSVVTVWGKRTRRDEPGIWGLDMDYDQDNDEPEEHDQPSESGDHEDDLDCLNDVEAFEGTPLYIYIYMCYHIPSIGMGLYSQRGLGPVWSGGHHNCGASQAWQAISN
jgi:hypothetical protein